MGPEATADPVTGDALRWTHPNGAAVVGRFVELVPHRRIVSLRAGRTAGCAACHRASSRPMSGAGPSTWTGCGPRSNGTTPVAQARPIGGPAAETAVLTTARIRFSRSLRSCVCPLQKIVGMSFTSKGRSVPSLAVTMTFLPSPSA